MRAVTLTPIPLTPEAFAPFGRVLTASGGRDFGRDGYDGWVLPFRAEGAARLQIVRYNPRPPVVRLIERHLHVSETRQPITGPPCILVVGRSSDAPPAPEDLVAFDLAGHGVLLSPGTWHSIDAYPRADAPSDFLFLSEEATVAELFGAAATPPVRTQMHDLAAAGVHLSFG
jgi:ureidoglycolate hydrolase